MRIKIIIITVVLMMILLVSDLAFSYQMMPPPGHTGAPPSEGTCFTTSCHTTRPPVNGGDGLLEISFHEGLTKYLPDSVYTLRVRLKDKDSYYFGFQMTAIDKANQMTGSFELIDTVRTHIMSSFNRDYISHYYAYDSINLRVDSSEWEFKWKAPAEDVGPVTFYAAGVAGDQAVSFPFGYVYTTSLEVGAGNVSVRPEHDLSQKIRLYPSPVKEYLQIVLPQPVADFEMKVFNAEGQLIRNYSIKAGTGSFKMDVQELEAGIYLIRISGKDFFGIRRFVKI